MFLPLKVGIQFSRSKKKLIMSNFISIASVVGITIGVAALIIGLSAMNGFEREVAHRVVGVMPTIELRSLSGYFDNTSDVIETLERQDKIKSATPGMVVSAMLNHDNKYRSARVTALDTANFKNIINLDDFMLDGVRVSDLQPGKNGYDSPGVILGKKKKKKLQVKRGDSVELIITKNSSDGALSAPMGLNCKVTGIFKIGGQLDGVLAYVDISSLRKLLGMNDDQSVSIFIDTGSFFHAYEDTTDAVTPIRNSISTPMGIQSWMAQAAPFYRDIQMVRTVMWLALLMVIVVSSFNIISILIMSVNEKRSEVAILMSMGYSRKSVLATFVVQGLIMSIYGTVFGVCLGLLIAYNLTEVINFIQSVTGITILKSETYFIDFVPTEVRNSDVLLISLSCILVTLLSTVLPGMKAAYIRPAVELSGK